MTLTTLAAPTHSLSTQAIISLYYTTTSGYHSWFTEYWFLSYINVNSSSKSVTNRWVCCVLCRAVLESHHASLAFQLSTRDARVNIFKNLDRSVCFTQCLSTLQFCLSNQLLTSFGAANHCVIAIKHVIIYNSHIHDIVYKSFENLWPTCTHSFLRIYICIEWSRCGCDFEMISFPERIIEHCVAWSLTWCWLLKWQSILNIWISLCQQWTSTWIIPVRTCLMWVVIIYHKLHVIIRYHRLNHSC